MSFRHSWYSKPYLGGDFLWHFGLLIYLQHSHLSNGITLLKVQETVSTIASPSSSLQQIQPQTNFHTILSEFPELLQSYCHDQPVKHDLTHHKYRAFNQSTDSMASSWEIQNCSSKNLSTCCNRVSFDHLHPHFIWYLRKPLETCIHVETTVLWIKWQPWQLPYSSHTTLQPLSMAQQFSPS